MDSTIRLNICSLLTWSLWVTGAGIFAAVAVELLPLRMSGLAFVVFASGQMLYTRRLVRAARRNVEAAFELGRLSVEGGKVRAVR